MNIELEGTEGPDVAPMFSWDVRNSKRAGAIKHIRWLKNNILANAHKSSAIKKTTRLVGGITVIPDNATLDHSIPFFPELDIFSKIKFYPTV